MPTARGLLATFPFLDLGSGLVNVNNLPDIRNDLALDLNAGLDDIPNGDPNGFADQAHVTVMFGSGGATPSTTILHIGPDQPSLGPCPHNVSLLCKPNRFDELIGHTPAPGEYWYEDVSQVNGGDGTVPLISSRDQFQGDSRSHTAGVHH